MYSYFLRRSCKGLAAILIVLSFAAALAGCGSSAPVIESTEAETAPEPSSEPTYQVTFYIGKDVLDQQTVAAGESPVLPSYEDPAYYLDSWLNDAQETVLPETEVISADTQFTALIFPRFRRTSVYLLPDSDGRLRPDDVLTFGELRRAMKDLTVSPEIFKLLYDWDSAEADAPVTEKMLSKIYGNPGVFPKNLRFQPEELSEDPPVTRRAFAERTFAILERNQKKVVIQDGQPVPADLNPADPEVIPLLDSCMAHTEDPNYGKGWTEAVMEMYWTPGYHLHNGVLYCADESGALLKNADVGRLHFNEGGCYTSGDPELDALTLSFIQKFQTENSTTDRDKLLEIAFFYIRDNMHYVSKEHLPFQASGWEPEQGLEALKTLRGNCYNYSAAFAMIARNLGFDAVAVSGKVLEHSSPHSWVMIDMDGETMFYDPQLAAREVVYHKRTNWGEDMFAMPADVAERWIYVW